MSIEIKNLYFSYDEKEILNDFSLNVNLGDKVCLFGRSGCGKSTVLRLIAGLETAKKGTITVDGRVSMVFQDDRLIPSETVMENILIVNPSAEREEILDLLEKFGIEGSENLYPEELSGGMARRVALIRALIFQADILLLDEPFNGIDQKTLKKIIPEIKSRSKDKIVILVTHDISEAEAFEAEIINMTK